ncbi:YicC/YloC family endoribonuclease [Oribacterium sp. WCC10]|uniref:YicC/YloC family endoribonuclease n=1 Tax=Oribacterium sp. WCC10 TaxID=1855343 RepID=UPI0008EFF7D0|nr:YicC/YloC family endoribonuclease [Oribacterium sp. WCC10]SFG41997.1 TIGR00255 family protein [Oribacterium sp. WCC10]
MDLKSMTGFGRCEVSNDIYRLSVEVKSVNSRFLDLNIKMPKKFNALEANIRNTIKEFISRGKVDLFITYDEFGEGSKSLRLNMDLAREYLDSMRKICLELGVDDNIKVTNIASLPDVLVLSEESEDEDELWNRLEPALRDALTHFVDTRISEGINLQKDLLEKLSEMEEIVKRIDERSPEITAVYEQKLRAKVTELLGTASIDESRIVQEVTIYSDKICTDEERVRLHSHIKNMRSKLTNGGSVGRELDFLAQEMNREANTTLSKANDLIISDDAIGLKTLIEKIREQIQNLE